jgi:hypothetical protein
MTTITIDAGQITGNNISIYGVGGTGFIAVNQQSVDPSGMNNYLIVSADSSGNMTTIKPNGFVRKFADNNTASRTYTFDDIDDTVTLNSCPQTLTNKTLNDATNNVVANAVRAGGSSIDFSASGTPAIGQIMIATTTSTATWQNLPLNYFGTPVDGDTTISVNTTLVRDMYYNNLTVNTGIALNTGGFRIFVAGTLTLTGTANINRNGNNGTNGDTGTTGGVALAAGSVGGSTVGGNGGAAGAGGSAGGAPTGGTSVGGGGGRGGNGNAGATVGANGGTISVVTAANGSVNVLRDVARGMSGRHLGNAVLSGGTGGGGGGGGSTGASRNGGGGGSGGGVVIIAANIITGTGTITANGGTGGTGSNSGSTNGGGGGGGGGGTVLLVNNQMTNGFTIAQLFVDGGAGGTASTGGAAGTAGTAGTIVLL